MSEDYGNDYVTIIDDDGNEFELEHLDTAEINGEVYMVFVPADLDEDDEEYGLIILKVVTEDGEEVFTSVDDEEELNTAYELFVERLSEDEEDESDLEDEFGDC